MYRLEAVNLGKRFDRRVLFRALSFSLEGGGSLAITGSNGSGKSTLLRILAGVMSANRGEVRLMRGGTVLGDDDRRLHAGLVAPYLNVYDGFSTRENLRFIADARRLPRAQERIERALDLVELADRADDRVETYSSGMKQRVKYAAAVLAEPPLLLLDEPSSNLDEAGIRMVRRVMDHHQATGRLLIVATNDAREAAACDRTLCIEDFVSPGRPAPAAR